MLTIRHRHWDELGNSGPCPFSFTKEELDAHREDGEGWNEIADFWDEVSELANRDGWTPSDLYDQAREVFAARRAEGLARLDGKAREDWDEETKWAA